MPRHRRPSLFHKRANRLGALLMLCLGVLTTGLVWPCAAFSADAAATSVGASGKSLAETIQSKRGALTAQIEILSKVEAKETSDADQTDVSAAEEDLEMLQSLDAVYAQQQARLEQRAELEADKKK